MSFYLLELQHEEIPASFISVATDYLKTAFAKELANNNISLGAIYSEGTPRRLALFIKDIADIQTSVDEEITGPPAAIAFNADGSLSAVGSKFVSSKSIDPSTVIKTSTPKGDYLKGIKRSSGIATKELLKTLTPKIVRNIPFAKSMKWSDIDYKFARPIHSIISLYNDEIISFEIAKVVASDHTVGHRFLAPQSFKVKDFEDYKSKLKSAYVILAHDERKKIIEMALHKAADEHGYKLEGYENLLETVADIIEYPAVIIGGFDSSYLALPSEVLITSMKVHQKFFPLFDKNGKITNKFLGVSNTFSKDNSNIALGYERVLKARLYDALFFYNNDKAVKLTEMTERLKSVTYQEKLGSSYDKVTRFTSVADYLAKKLAPEKSGDIKTICNIAKSDLMSEMVYEFPELQGVMGRYYARNEGYSENIASAINEHYSPRYAGGKLPSTIEAKIVSIADKIDTIAGIFAINMSPTGNADPYALRRSAIGIINMIIESKLDIDLKELSKNALSNFTNIVKFDEDEVLTKMLNFLMLRFKQIAANFETSPIDTETFDSLASRYFEPVTLIDIAKVLDILKSGDDFKTVVKSYKRINNILKKNEHKSSEYDKKILIKLEEKSLADAIENSKVFNAMQRKEYLVALKEILVFAPLIDSFFENVMVMDDDLNVRASRLSLITKLKEIFNIVADLDSFSIIS